MASAHQIHYSLPWTQNIEGHRDVVVHAPLNLVLMLELYRKAHGDTKSPSSFEYRAVSPIYAHENYTINLTDSGEIWCEKGTEKQVCMTGKIQ
jgi:hydroxyacyl-ACP dehydratase HTD2-like protein with hotdog domain